MLKFWKMNGAGNDFVILDNRDGSNSLSNAQIERLCNRQRGVGADGLLAVEPAQNGADFRMRYYNADGGEAEMCGNGARCFGKFLNFLHDETLEKTTFETIAGVITADFFGENVRVQLSPPFDLALNAELDLAGEKRAIHSVNTGVPHAVVFVDDLPGLNLVKIGNATRFHEHFAPNGTNANFVQINAPGDLTVRTYERGVEGETLACGTGMAACAIIHHQLTGATPPIKITVAGGETLEVGFEHLGDDRYENVTLLGPAEFTFEGQLSLHS